MGDATFNALGHRHILKMNEPPLLAIGRVRQSALVGTVGGRFTLGQNETHLIRTIHFLGPKNGLLTLPDPAHRSENPVLAVQLVKFWPFEAGNLELRARHNIPGVADHLGRVGTEFI